MHTSRAPPGAARWLLLFALSWKAWECTGDPRLHRRAEERHVASVKQRLCDRFHHLSFCRLSLGGKHHHADDALAFRLVDAQHKRAVVATSMREHVPWRTTTRAVSTSC